jgi:hypothetical protein
VVDASLLKEKEQGGGSFKRGREDESVNLYVEDDILLCEQDDNNEENRREKEEEHKRFVADMTPVPNNTS